MRTFIVYLNVTPSDLHEIDRFTSADYGDDAQREAERCARVVSAADADGRVYTVERVAIDTDRAFGTTAESAYCRGKECEVPS